MLLNPIPITQVHWKNDMMDFNIALFNKDWASPSCEEWRRGLTFKGAEGLFLKARSWRTRLCSSKEYTWIHTPWKHHTHHSPGPQHQRTTWARWDPSHLSRVYGCRDGAPGMRRCLSWCSSEHHRHQLRDLCPGLQRLAWACPSPLLREIWDAPTSTTNYEWASKKAKLTPFPGSSPQQEQQDHITESQNHRIVGVGRDLCGSSSPTPCRSRVTYSRL